MPTPVQGMEAIYVSWRVPPDSLTGAHTGKLVIKVGQAASIVPVNIEVFPAIVPAEGKLEVTNWFNIGNMASRHGLETWSEEHWEMIRRYGPAHAPRPAEPLLGDARHDRNQQGCRRRLLSFDFSRVERLIRMYLGLGFTHIDGGHLITRTSFNAPFFVLTTDREIRATSVEAYDFYAQYLPAWRDFLNENGWLGKLVQHIGDEPLEQSAPDYRIVAGIVRKYLPEVKIIDAVEIAELGGAVDIWVPKNSYYEAHIEQFEKHRRYGDTVWFYTCCFPGGHYMNRLLDMPLLRTRLLHWGNYRYDLKGFLHWGFNMYRANQDPFEENCPAHGADGKDNLPAGDTHIAYPGPDGPWSSVRLEAQGRGAEDFELLMILAERNKRLADDITALCVRSFKSFTEDPEVFDTAHRKLLDAVLRLIRPGGHMAHERAFQIGIERAASWLRKARRPFFITGAGISADSGLPTYRGVGGIYENEEMTEDGVPIEVAPFRQHDRIAPRDKLAAYREDRERLPKHHVQPRARSHRRDGGFGPVRVRVDTDAERRRLPRRGRLAERHRHPRRLPSPAMRRLRLSHRSGRIPESGGDSTTVPGSADTTCGRTWSSSARCCPRRNTARSSTC